MADGHFDGWIAVDFDGTLAVYDKWEGPTHIGAPIPTMVERVKAWVQAGERVRIFSARVYAPPDSSLRQVEAAKAMIAIQDWCEKHLGFILPVTCVKDFGMIVLWDDRCVQVERNTGKPVGEK